VIRVNDATAIRPMGDSDMPFIVDSWLKSFQFGKNRRHAEPGSFAKLHFPVVRHLIENSPRRLIACDPDAPENIQGWALADIRADRLPVVHYVYVREAFKDVGLTPLLFSAVTGGAKKVILSHLAPALEDHDNLIRDVEVVFDPYSIVLRQPPEQEKKAS
jgi:hypothetical protein